MMTFFLQQISGGLIVGNSRFGEGGVFHWLGLAGMVMSHCVIQHGRYATHYWESQVFIPEKHLYSNQLQ